jgi:hypothetical protein
MPLLHRIMPRHLLFCLATAFFAIACKNDSGKAAALQSALSDSSRYTTIQWLDSVRNFGTIPEGQKLEVAFRFKNTGTMPLVIVKVQPSCGCTVADQPTEPIAPGAEGQIKAIFNSKGHAGVNHKTLFVTANTRGSRSHSLTFLVIVERTAS